MRVTIYANCQGFGLAHFMRKARFTDPIEVFENYKLILKEQTPEQLKASASRCDCFIYQPTKELGHGDLSAEYYVREVIPKHARTLAIPYLYNHGFFPLIGHGDGVLGADYLPVDYWKIGHDELMALYDSGQVDFGLTARVLACAAEQARRELDCHVRLADWIVDHRHVPLFINFNHPAGALFAQLAREVLSAILDTEMGSIEVNGLNEAGLPCDLPVSQYVIDEFEWRIQAHPAAHKHYRALLAHAWKQKHER